MAMTEQERREFERTMFREKLIKLIHYYGELPDGNTPDDIVADYLIECMGVFARATERRSEWWDAEWEYRNPSPPSICKRVEGRRIDRKEQGDMPIENEEVQAQ